MKKMLNFNLTEPLYRVVLDIALRKGLSVTEILRRAVEAYVKQESHNG